MIRTLAVAGSALVVVALTGCEKGAGSASCGIDALTAPLAVKQSFAEGNALAELPGTVPTAVPIRLVAGPAWRGTVASEGQGHWAITTHGSVSKEARVGFGVLVVDYHDNVLGVLAYDGHSVYGARDFGTLAIGDTVVPLLGVRISPAAIQNPKCPVFPDSLR